MAGTTVRIVLDDKAYELALKPPAPEIASLHPAARAMLEHAEWTAGANPVRVVRCTTVSKTGLRVVPFAAFLTARLIFLSAIFARSGASPSTGVSSSTGLETPPSTC